MSAADSNAFQTVQLIPGLTSREQQYLLTVARGEGFYGLGWGTVRKINAGTTDDNIRFGIDPKAGVGSFNWGAIQGKGSAGSFPHVDHHRDGTAYVGQYKKYGSDAEGAADMARILLKPNVKAALATGDLMAAVNAQHSNGYFELDPAKYIQAVKRNYEALTAALKWPVLLTVGGAASTAVSPLAPGLESESSEPLAQFSGSSPLPEAGFLRGEKYSVPGVQDEPKKT